MCLFSNSVLVNLSYCHNFCNKKSSNIQNLFQILYSMDQSILHQQCKSQQDPPFSFYAIADQNMQTALELKFSL